MSCRIPCDDRYGTRPLDAVADAGAPCLRAEIDEDANAAREAQEHLMSATTAAMREGIPLREISAAEQRGRTGVRDELRSDTLRRVERTGRQMRDAETNHRAAIARASRLGLSTRDIAQAAGVTHGTIRAISQRLGDREAVSTSADDTSSDTSGAG